MEIKRITEILVETERQYVVRQPEYATQVFCPACNEPTLVAEQIAGVFGISRRVVYRIVERDAAHFTEIETGAVMICLTSLAAFLESGAKGLIGETIDDFLHREKQ